MRRIFAIFHTVLLQHSVVISEIYSQAFLAKISWKQGFLKEITKYVDDLTKYFFSENFCILPLCNYVQCVTSSRANFTKEKFI